MQHYHAPTRLLDWTHSPYVAAYFAVENHWNKDGVIWYFNWTRYPSIYRSSASCKIQRVSKTLPTWTWNNTDPDRTVVLYVYADEYGHDRSVSQRGLFTTSNYVLSDHAVEIDKASTDQQVDAVAEFHPTYGKLKIPRHMKSEFLQNLLYMNISANSLFPGMDGIGRSMNELGRLRVKPSPPSRGMGVEAQAPVFGAPRSGQTWSGPPPTPESPPGG
jgi:hypothetical protein